MAAGKRSDPTKLAKERAAIDTSKEIIGLKDLQTAIRMERVQRSRQAARRSAEKFAASGEDTLGGQMQRTYDDLAQRREERRNPPPSIEGARVIGIKKNNSPV